MIAALGRGFRAVLPPAALGRLVAMGGSRALAAGLGLIATILIAWASNRQASASGRWRWRSRASPCIWARRGCARS
ncbi:MAG: hypothetical protein R3D28_12815 [Geminicoccaceae bacterium]